GMFVGVVLLLAMGAVSLLVIGVMSQQMRLITQVHTQDTLADALKLEVTLQSHLRGMAIMTQQQSYNDDIAASRARFQVDLAAFDTLGSPEATAILQRVREADQRFEAAGDRVLALYRAGNVGGATRLDLDQEHAISHELEAALQRLEAQNDDEYSQAIGQFDFVRGLLTVMVGAFAGVSLVTALLLGFVLSWALIRPVRRIDRAL